MELEKLIIPLIADTEKFIRSLKEAQKQTEESSKSMVNQFKSIGDQMTKIGGMMSLAVTTPIVLGMKESISAASDLNETVSKVGVVFGDQSEKVMKFGESSATALGMSKNAALSAAGTYGNLFVSMGMATDKSAEMSMELVGLASDLASFNNLDPTIVLDKLRAGLTGESEPLKTLGININEAIIKEKAMELGLYSGVGAIDAASKAQAVYALMLQQTGTAQGDFARTSDGLANSTRIMQAEFENVKASFGEVLLPLATQLMQNLIPILKFFNDLPMPVKQGIVVFLGLLAALGPVITALGTLMSVGSTIAGLFGTGGALAGAMTFITGTAIPALIGAISAISLPVLALIAAIGALIFVWNKYGAEATNTLKMIKAIFDATLLKIGWWFQDTFTAAINGVSNAISSLITWVQGLGNAFSNLKIPDWFTPGSPMPLTIALGGLDKELSKVTDTTLGFSSEIGMSGVVMPSASQNIQSTNNQDQSSILRSIEEKVGIDYEKLARSIVGEMMKVSAA